MNYSIDWDGPGERDHERDLVDGAPEPLKRLGARLADLLDADSWNNIEPLLLEIAEEHQRLSSASGAWGIVLKWLGHYDEEERMFSRYRDNVILDGIMTAAQRRAVSALFPLADRSKPEPRECGNCGQKLPLLFPCHEEECPIAGSR